MESSESVGYSGRSSESYGGRGGESTSRSSSRKSYVSVEAKEYAKFKIFQNDGEIKKLAELKNQLSAEIDALPSSSLLLKKLGKQKLQELNEKIATLKKENAKLVQTLDDEKENQ